MAIEGIKTLPTDPIVLSKLKGCVEEISNSLTRQASERDFIKEAIKAFHEEHKVDKKLIRKLAKTHFKDSIRKSIEDTNDLAALYSATFKVNLDEDEDDVPDEE